LEDIPHLQQGRIKVATLRDWDTMEVIRLYRLESAGGRFFFDFRIGSMTSLTFADWTGAPEDDPSKAAEVDPGGIRIIGHRLEMDPSQLPEAERFLREYIQSSGISTEYI
jgi:hypothetical protein